MHNLSTVFWFEVIRTLKKKSFWLVALSFPVIIAAVFGIIYFSNLATSDAYERAAKEKFSIGVTDTANHIQPGLLDAYEARDISSREAGIVQVEAGELDAYFYYPTDLQEQHVEVHAKDIGIFENSRYGAAAELLLSQSSASNVDENDAVVLQGNVNYDATTYRDGEPYNAIAHMIAPGFFLVLFYFLIAMFANQMLTSTTEEKENRVIEMILTTVRAKTLIFGKILSLIVLAFIQSMLVTLPVIVGYFLVQNVIPDGDQLIPAFDFSQILFDPLRITIAVLVFAVSFMLFTGLLVAISAAVPTAKEANNFFGLLMILIFGPLYATPVFISSPDAIVVQALSYFPFTAPIPLMLRNAVGNLDMVEAAIALVIMIVTAIVILNIAVKVFRYGVIEYNRTLRLSEIFRPRK